MNAQCTIDSTKYITITQRMALGLISRGKDVLQCCTFRMFVQTQHHMYIHWSSLENGPILKWNNIDNTKSEAVERSPQQKDSIQFIY